MRSPRSLAIGGCLAVAALVMSSQASTQQRPNFSGTWRLQNAAEALADVPVTLNIVHDAAHIAITRTIGASSTSRTHVLQPAVVSGRVDASGTNKVTHVWWLGDSLRFDEGTYDDRFATQYRERTENWSLTENGRLTIEITVRRSGERTSRFTSVYKKQPAD